ncbi:DUF4167 domain-containing protein [Stappia taiwanensis]|uniref:DUF4167 domain-containing protein n=1 Tax=Stappia taiwanensis TaxID=992267 RepID=A0A838XNH7_9HYPH|nr:DUF4167 domain-containing protein [Stappia taiwanensis]MBA4611347.1 DUF4167 domain-containing protein [Stappia taiwanensis]GGF01012.1 hypothetical protein GCM10007285_30780 [Stappia taiwanensis]
MRPGNQNNKRIRGRGGRKGPNPLSRAYESNGPDVKIRGTAHHVAEKYQQLARDAAAAGDRVMSENYFQHAEHYLRIIAAAQQSMQQPVVLPRGDGADEGDTEAETGNREERSRDERGERSERGRERRGREQAAPAPAAAGAPVMPLDAPQPFVDNMPVLNAKAGDEASGDSDGDEERGRRRARGTRGRGVRRPKAETGEAEASNGDAPDAAAKATPTATAAETAAEAAPSNGAAEPAGQEVSGEVSEKKPRAKRAPRTRKAAAPKGEEAEAPAAPAEPAAPATNDA